MKIQKWMDLRMDRQTPYFIVANVRQDSNEDKQMARPYTKAE